MKWTFQDYKHYSAEHLHKLDKQRLTQNALKDYLPVRRNTSGKRHPRFQH